MSHHNAAKAIPDIFSYRELKLGTRPVENSTPCVGGCVCVCAQLLQSSLTLCNPWTVARQTPLS